MAINPAADALCQGLENGVQDGINAMNRSSEKVEDSLRDIQRATNNIVPTPPANLLAARLEIDANMGNLVPDFASDGFSAACQLIRACTGLPTFDPLALVAGATSGALSRANDLMSGLQLGELPEFSLGNMLNDINLNFQTNLDLPVQIPQMDGIINCLALICGRDVSGLITGMNDAINNLSASDDGGLDIDLALSRLNIGPQLVQNLRDTFSTLSNVTDNIRNSVQDGLSTLMNLSSDC